MRHLCQQLKLLVMQSLLRGTIISVASRHSLSTQTVNYNPFQEGKLHFKPLPSSYIRACQESDPATSRILSYKSHQRNLTKEDHKNESAEVKVFMQEWKNVFVGKVCIIGGVDKLHNWSYHLN